METRSAAKAMARTATAAAVPPCERVRAGRHQANRTPHRHSARACQATRGPKQPSQPRSRAERAAAASTGASAAHSTTWAPSAHQSIPSDAPDEKARGDARAASPCGGCIGRAISLRSAVSQKLAAAEVGDSPTRSASVAPRTSRTNAHGSSTPAMCSAAAAAASSQGIGVRASPSSAPRLRESTSSTPRPGGGRLRKGGGTRRGLPAASARRPSSTRRRASSTARKAAAEAATRDGSRRSAERRCDSYARPCRLSSFGGPRQPRQPRKPRQARLRREASARPEGLLPVGAGEGAPPLLRRYL
mmetsp:Transcript_12757/g.40694  ORF Transcript_12757/g.40694 Transcript_12757/m.40694 type:complete len:303 (+) Transcript_12757:417-1325(+)